jgi:tRNA A-37 threonylcarbamoyl transferase component Bud32
MGRRFRFGDHIGSGGFGTVEAAVRIDDDGDVVEDSLAQKKLLPEHLDDSEALARFKREVRYLAEMDHPNVIPVLGRNLSASPPWFVMPRAEGCLRDVLSARAGDQRWVITTFSAILEAMAYAHTERRVVHRDLKPENVLMVNEVPMVSDFGLGKRLDSETTRLTSTNIAMGTLAYMAPEQFKDAARVGPPADVYALGKMLGEMLNGERPDIGRPLLTDFPIDFREFIDKCTQDDPRDRYTSGTDAFSAFQMLVSGAGLTGEISRDLDTLIKLWEAAPLGEDGEEARAVAQELISRQDDEEFYFKAVPRLPTALVEQLIDEQPTCFDIILRAYDGHIQGGLPFDYCDVVANFYRRMFAHTQNVDHKRLIFERLFELGPSHNRWHVGDVVAELISDIDDGPTIEMAIEVIRESPSYARWYETYIEGVQLPEQVRAAFDSLRPDLPEGNVPF